MLSGEPVRHCGRCGQLCTSGISIFADLDREDQRSLVKIARHVDIKKGQVLFEAGERANRIIAMRYGRLKLRRLTVEGQEMVLGYLEQGEVMGEDTLYADALYDMDLVAAEDSGVCLILTEAVSALALSRPQLGVGLLNSLGKKLHAARQLTDVLSRRQATARLAGFLLHQGGGELSLSREEMAASVGQVHRRVEKHWPHMDQVWPGLDYTRHNLILFHVDEELKVKDAWLVSTNEKRRLNAQEYQDLALPQPGGYGSLTFQGKPSISVSLDDYSVKLWGEDEQTFRTATHELVHFYYQDQMNLLASGGRAQAYPLDAQPRYYRQMIFQRLISALEDPAQREDSLARAKHWLNKWQEEYPEEAEAIRDTDLMEGGAQYVENLGALVGEGATGEAFDQLAAKSIYRDELFPSADGESYELGYVAGLLLDKLQPGWKEGIYQGGMSPVEALLKDVEAQSEPDDPAIKAAVNEDIKEMNAIAAEDLADIIKAQADKAVPMLRINVKNTSTSYEARGNYRLDGEDVITGLATQYQAGNGVIDIRGLGVYVQYSEAEGESFVIPLTMAHEVKDGVLNIQSQKPIVDGVKVQTSQEAGRTVYQVAAGEG